MAQIEGGAAAIAFASGMAATMAVFQAFAPGDHVVAPLDAYYGTPKLLKEHFLPWGLEASFVDMTDLQAVEAAIKPATRLVWTETPSNPTIAVTDLRGRRRPGSWGGGALSPVTTPGRLRFSNVRSPWDKTSWCTPQRSISRATPM
jgi:hypothetical protein